MATLLVCHAAAAYDSRVDDIMYQDPAFPETTERTEFGDNLKPLWLQALARPEAELQRLAADTIALAHRAGMAGLEDTADELLATLQQDQLEPSVRRAVVGALAALDARQAARTFADSMTTGTLEIARIVEPALARWDYQPARVIWRERLKDTNVEPARLQLAIQCLGAVQDAESMSALLQIVKDTNVAAPVRLLAAQAAAGIEHPELLATAAELTSRGVDQPTAGLLATALLDKQQGAPAVAVLRQLAATDSVTTRGAALRRLYDIDPRHVYEFAAAAIQSTDVNVRKIGADAFAHRADADSVRLLGPLLDDRNPGLRYAVSESLIRLGRQADLRDVVIQSATEIVAQDGWRGAEQGVIVLALLDHKPAAPRFVELLAHPRPEVLVTAAWGLRKLGVPETFPAMLVRAEQQTQLVIDETFEPQYIESLDMQLSHIFQAFGVFGYAEAEPLMRKFIPKQLLYGGDARPAAVWAIGKLHEGTVDEALAKVLAERLADVISLMPEVDSVRRMSAIAIGRMKAESQLAVLRRHVIEVPGIAGQACGWSLERMTGESYPFSLELVSTAADWFLTPLTTTRPNETD